MTYLESTVLTSYHIQSDLHSPCVVLRNKVSSVQLRIDATKYVEILCEISRATTR